MAVQKKKRNIILKYVWKKNQLKNLLKLSLFSYNKILSYKIYSSKNIKITSVGKYSFTLKLFCKSKFTFLTTLKKFNWLNIFNEDYKLISFNSHYLNSVKLISFLLNFHDNIVRDLSAKKFKNIISMNHHFFFWKKLDISIILLKLKKVFKYFFIFLDYFNFSKIDYCYNLYIAVKHLFSFFKNINIINYYTFNNLPQKTSSIRFNYLLFNDALNENYSLKNYANKELGYFYHHKVFDKNKFKYIQLLKTIKKRSKHFYYKYLIRQFCKSIKVLNISNKPSNNTSYYAINYLQNSIFNLTRHCLYPKFLISKVLLYNCLTKKKLIKPNIFIYKKNFDYFQSNNSVNFYNNNHVCDWEFSVFDVFSQKDLSKDVQLYFSTKYLSNSYDFFDEFIWSWHIVFTNNRSYNNLKFFNNNFDFSFIHFFFKICKLRIILNFLLFLLLPLNLNLIWSEANSSYPYPQKKVALDYLKSKIPATNWFFINKFYTNRIKNWFSKKFFLKKKSNNTLKFRTFSNFYKFLLLTQYSFRLLRVVFKPYLKPRNQPFLRFEDVVYFLIGRFKVKPFRLGILKIGKFRFNIDKFLNFKLVRERLCYAVPDDDLNYSKVRRMNSNLYIRKYGIFLDKVKLFLFRNNSFLISNIKTILSSLRFNSFYKKLFYLIKKKYNKLSFVKKIKQYSSYGIDQLYLNYLFNYNFKSNKSYIKQNYFFQDENKFKNNTDSFKKPTLFSLLSSTSSISKTFDESLYENSLYLQNLTLYFVHRETELCNTVSTFYDLEASFVFMSFYILTNPLRKLNLNLFYIFFNYFLIMSNFFSNIKSIARSYINTNLSFFYKNIILYYYFVKLKWIFLFNRW